MSVIPISTQQKATGPSSPPPPFIPGHEGVGFVSGVGKNVKTVKEGDRVGIVWLYSACGQCVDCLAGQESCCSKAEFGGYTKNGGYAEYAIADPNYVAHLPKNVGFIDVAPIVCAGVTVYKGLKSTEAKPGEWVVISGIGGLGHLAVQYAKAMGLHVAAVDVSDEKLALARSLGASLTVNARTQDPRGLLPEGDRRSPRSTRHGALHPGVRSSHRHGPPPAPPSRSTACPQAPSPFPSLR